MQDQEILDWLSSRIDRWLSEKSTRNLNTLVRKTGVSYATLKRIQNKDAVPNDYTCLSLLSVVSTIEEFLQFFEQKNPVFCRFILQNTGRIAARLNNEVAARLTNRDSFVCLTLAYTVGVRAEDVEKVSGALGVMILRQLIEEGVLKEGHEGRYIPNTESDKLVVLNMTLSKNIVQYISELQALAAQPQNLFFAYNVTENDYQRILAIFREAEEKALEIARLSGGDIPIIHSVITSKLLDKEASE